MYQSFCNGYPTGNPSSVIVAHKFAERTIVDPKTGAILSRQLHECGIVYAQRGTEPYTFCIMTEGENYSDLQGIIQDISLEIYTAMVNADE